MGPHGTWFDFLPGLETLQHNLEIYMGREWTWQVFQATHFEVNHLLGTLLVLLLATLGAMSYARQVRRADDGGVVPPAYFGVRNLFELLGDVVFGIVANAADKKDVPRLVPLIGSLFVFILFANLLSLVPGFLPPTDTLKTNLALAGLVFVMTHAYGFKAHGLGYLKHFLGPVWWLAPLMLPIEIISHLARPVSLSLRLLGNISADHKVVGVFFGLVPLLVPVPFLVMGVLVSFVQAFVFSLLSSVYVASAMAHDH